MLRRMVALGAVAAACLVAASASGHPSEEERARAREARARCTASVPDEARRDPARLGMREGELRRLLESRPEESGLSPPEAEADASDSDAGLSRLERSASGDLARVHYELWQGRVYRIRWRLAPRFERPVLDALVERARLCFGRPELDQTFPAEPGSRSATYRRVVWQHEERRIELRQLHPLRGGPVHLVVSSRAELRAIREAGASPPPLPHETGPWWARGAAPVVPATPEEAETLGRDFLALLAHADH